MTENKKHFYLYDRWFEYQSRAGEKLIYVSIPKNESSEIKIEINKKTSEVTLLYFDNKNLISKIEISDITKSNIELHYIQVECSQLEMNNNIYDNLLIELFAMMNKDGILHDYQIKFVKMDKPSNFTWVEPPFQLNEKINMNDIEYESKKVNNFMDFTSFFPIHIKKLKEITVVQAGCKSKIDNSDIKEIVIPQKLEVYDRVYHLINTIENKFILRNDEDGVRDLEIKYDPVSFSILSVNLKLKRPTSVEEGIIKIVPNSLNGVTAQYFTKKKTRLSFDETTMKQTKIRSKMIFDSNRQKIENSILITSKEKKTELLEHPYINNNYIDGEGNIHKIGNSGYNVFYGIASYAPGIFRSIDNKIFKSKVLQLDESKKYH